MYELFYFTLGGVVVGLLGLGTHKHWYGSSRFEEGPLER